MSSINHLGLYKDCPFTFEQIPDLEVVAAQETPWLIIETHTIAIELGGTALRLAKSPIIHPDLELRNGRWAGVRRSLGTLAAHNDAGAGLRRYEFVDAPYHSALHIVDDAADTTPNYCTVHTHSDVAELNVIVPSCSNEGLTYDVTDGDESEQVQEPSILWFPPNVKHCATASVGNGLFFVARLPVAANKVL